ncbi:serine hydrolase domain-containing protein [Mycolicibacterium mucogenicum]|uniref:serine hydrolase domain-containing protein n=1 Tax=Mycolicibacterium mucogenicum TaxID=56689 RepID=UPI001F27AFE3|nr:serine hydrolase domain-containing protein [Mycolicibacterium mucogenicum]
MQGRCDPRFSELRDLVAGNLASGAEVGLSVAATIDGEPVVDVWGGYADQNRRTPWRRDTITNVWSCTKTVTALAAAILVDRGQIDLDAPVRHYWPEFAQNGKENVQIRQLLSHSSGVSGWDAPFRVADLSDEVAATNRLAGQAPWWAPGSASGYHMVNFGHLIGGVIRRVDGRRLGEFIQEEIADPLGADFQLGARRSDYARVSDVIPPPDETDGIKELDPTTVAGKTSLGPLVLAADALSETWRSAEIGGANGHTNARALARIHSTLACGGRAGDLQLLNEETVDAIFSEQTNGTDLVLGVPVRWGLGFALPNESAPRVLSGNIAFWSGYGGSHIIIDRDRRMTFSYVMNKMQPDASLVGSENSLRYLAAMYAGLD